MTLPASHALSAVLNLAQSGATRAPEREPDGAETFASWLNRPQPERRPDAARNAAPPDADTQSERQRHHARATRSADNARAEQARQNERQMQTARKRQRDAEAAREREPSRQDEAGAVARAAPSLRQGDSRMATEAPHAAARPARDSTAADGTNDHSGDATTTATAPAASNETVLAGAAAAANAVPSSALPPTTPVMSGTTDPGLAAAGTTDPGTATTAGNPQHDPDQATAQASHAEAAPESLHAIAAGTQTASGPNDTGTRSADRQVSGTVPDPATDNAAATNASVPDGSHPAAEAARAAAGETARQAMTATGTAAAPPAPASARRGESAPDPRTARLQASRSGSAADAGAEATATTTEPRLESALAERPNVDPDLADTARPGSMFSLAMQQAQAVRGGDPRLLTQPVATATIPVPIDEPGFSAALARQAASLAIEGHNRAEIQVTPADMGPIRIRIELGGDSATIDFSASQAGTRQAIEASLATLRSLLADQGLRMTEARVDAGGSFADGGRQAGTGQENAANAQQGFDRATTADRGADRSGHDGQSGRPGNDLARAPGGSGRLPGGDGGSAADSRLTSGRYGEPGSAHPRRIDLYA